MMNNDQTYDAIIIGSGIGGLTCASLLAQIENRRVLVLERHFTAGGYTHTFKRKNKFRWDVGLHYVGEMYRGSRYRNLFDFISGGRMDWTAMPQAYDCYHYPRLTFNARRNFTLLQQDLIDQFPGHSTEIQAYFRDVVLAAKWFARFMIGKIVPGWLAPLRKFLTSKDRYLALMSTRQYLDTHISDVKLRGILASQWGDYGLPPHLSTFGLHAVMVCHMQYGGFYPVGGSKSIADNIVPEFVSKGGQVLLKHRATKILTDGNKAIGVEVATRKRGKEVRERYFSDLIISDAGYLTTFSDLLPDHRDRPLRQELVEYPKAMSQVCVYIGFKKSPRSLGLNGENHWIFKSFDHVKMYQSRNQIIEGKASTCFASFPSLKDPDAHGHTAELITFMDYEPFRRWADKPWGKRGDDYQAVKDNIAEALIGLVDDRFPGFRDLIAYQEVSTPLSIHGFTGHRNGSVYGLPGTPSRFASNRLTPRTTIKNLYMTGVDVAGPGIVGGLLSGFLTSLVVSKNKRKLFSILAAAQRNSWLPEFEEPDPCVSSQLDQNAKVNTAL